MKTTLKSFVSRIFGFVALSTIAFSSALAAAPPAKDGQGFFTLASAESPYYGYYPDTYNEATPISLFVWMHGCGGYAYPDLYAIAPYATRASQSYVAISIGGRDNACWDVNSDAPKVLAAIADVSRYFNIDPARIYLGGYSSGGDMTYRVGFENIDRFAGLLVENSDPFRDSGLAQATVDAASWKINVAHLLHTEDAVYPPAGVRSNLAILTAKGFPVVKIERAGNHYDADGPGVGTNYDLRTALLPYLDAGWVSGGSATLTTAKKRITTNRAKIFVRGTSIGAQTLKFKAPGKKYRVYRGDRANWKIPVQLSPGNNVLILKATSASGKPTRLKIAIRRQL